MKRLIYILLMVVASLAWSCAKFDEQVPLDEDVVIDNVEILENGMLYITGTFAASSMGEVAVSSRATAQEDIITSAWCLVFGEDATYRATDDYMYTDNSPLLLKEPVTVNASGGFSITLPQYKGVGFLRFVANLTSRETQNLESTTAWGDDENNYYMSEAEDSIYGEEIRTLLIPGNTYDDVNEELVEGTITDSEMSAYGTFGQYKNQSVGLDGIYNITYSTTTTVDPDDDYSVTYNDPNEVQPKPSELSSSIPMSSVGFVMSKGITEETITDSFGTTVYMVRVASKATVTISDSDFSMSEIYMIDCPNEALLRSSVLTTDSVSGNSTSTTFSDLPVYLGGKIDYLALEEDVESGGTSSPVYFYPNSGGDYDYTGAVDQTVNPQYVIIKGRAGGYDTDGYYKVALKAQYALSYVYNEEDYSLETDEDGNYIVKEWSDLTYDILRNTHFKIDLTMVDKPGYKTYADAADQDSPASNISYTITIMADDGRNEVLVSKGTYYAELETSRVYVKGYMDDGIEGCYIDFSVTPSSGNTVPTIYVQSSDLDGEDTDDITIEKCVVTNGDDTTTYTPETNTYDDLCDTIVVIPTSDSDSATDVRVYFAAHGSGRIRLRIGDILKFIPVIYDPAPISMYGTKGQDGNGTTLLDGTTTTALVVTDEYDNQWSDFSYSSASDIEYYYDHLSEEDSDYSTDSNFRIDETGSVISSNESYTHKPQLRARIFPKNSGDGTAVLYLLQASDFKLVTSVDGDDEILDDSSADKKENYYVIFHSQGMVKENETSGLFTTVADTTVVFSVKDLNSVSVDPLTITIDTEVTTTDKDGNDPGWDEYFEEDITDDGQTLTLSVNKIQYDFEGLVIDEDEDSANYQAIRQAYVKELYENTLVLYDNTATSVVTVTNSAGDSKSYTVLQTQHPPIYLVDASGQSTKTYSVASTRTPGVCVFALNIWNYDLIDDEISEDSSTYIYRSTGLTVEYVITGYYTYTFWGTVYERFGQDTFKARSINCEFDNDYITNDYNWTSDSGPNVSGVNYAGTSRTTETYNISEIAKVGGYSEADHIFGVVREASTNSATSYDYAEATIIITVTDEYGYTYTTTKYLKATV